MNYARANVVPRLLAFVVDWLVLVLWGGFLFATLMLATGGDPPRSGGPWKAQAIGFVAMTLPFTLYFATCESSQMRASLGKRVVGLGVFRRSGQRLSFARALLRNAIKFTPWEFGHTLAQQLIFADEGVFPVWLWAPAGIAAIGPVWWVAELLVTGDTPYDRWAEARVVRSSKLLPRAQAASQAGQDRASAG